jgi:hypothetical protein
VPEHQVQMHPHRPSVRCRGRRPEPGVGRRWAGSPFRDVRTHVRYNGRRTAPCTSHGGQVRAAPGTGWSSSGGYSRSFVPVVQELRIRCGPARS